MGCQGQNISTVLRRKGKDNTLSFIYSLYFFSCWRFFSSKVFYFLLTQVVFVPLEQTSHFSNLVDIGRFLCLSGMLFEKTVPRLRLTRTHSHTCASTPDNSHSQWWFSLSPWDTHTRVCAPMHPHSHAHSRTYPNAHTWNGFSRIF